MPITQYAIEEFISVHAAAVTTCGASDMVSAVPQSQHWISNICLASIFQNFPPPEIRPFAINFIRRVSAGFTEYNLARIEVMRLVQDSQRRWSSYFAALSHFEMAISQFYLAIDSIRKLRQFQLFNNGDCSFEESLNHLYNTSKHEIARDKLPLWFSDDGLHTDTCVLTFSEIEDFMHKMAGIARALTDQEYCSNALKST